MSRNVKATGSRRPEFRSLEERMWWARETAGLTQTQLGAQLGISKRTVQNYEAGVGHPSEDRLTLWANACDVDYEWLAGDFYDTPGHLSRSRRLTKGSNREYTRSPHRGGQRAVACAAA
jgi:transcriptional regulator with XRE-family HTH domain